MCERERDRICQPHTTHRAQAVKPQPYTYRGPTLWAENTPHLQHALCNLGQGLNPWNNNTIDHGIQIFHYIQGIYKVCGPLPLVETQTSHTNIVLQEIWYREDSPNWLSYKLQRASTTVPPSKLTGIREGRDSGGKLIWYKSELTHFIKLIKTGAFHIWLEINKGLNSS